MTLIVLVHIPKTAGTTLSRSIRLRLALEPRHWFCHRMALGFSNLGYSNAEDLERRYERIASLSPDRQNRVSFFAAHAGFTIVERLPQPARVITMLRDPVRRVISTWKYLRKLGAIDATTTLERFALGDQQVHPYFVDNAQVRYLGVEHGRFIDGPPGTCPPEALDLAIRRVDHGLFFTGLTERFDESVVLLAEALGWRPLYYARARVSTPPQDAPRQFPQELRDAIGERNALDAALYEHACRRFDERIARAGPAFAERLKMFESRNRIVRRVLAPLAASTDRGAR